MSTIFKHLVQAGTVDFNGGTPPDGARAWAVDIMEGWKTGGEVEERSTELGSYRDGVSASGFFPVRKRYIVIGGYVYASSEVDAEALHDVLVRDAFPRNKLITLTRHEAVPKYVLGRRSAAVEVDWSAVQTGFRWQTTLMCEDPLKYALGTETVSGGVAGLLVGGHTFPVTFPHTFDTGSAGGENGLGVSNLGTAYSPALTATLVGYLGKGSWRLQNDTTGEYIGFDTALQTTDTLVIDFKEQTALLNGYPISASYFGTFWKLAPGSNTIRLYAEYDPSAMVTIEYSSAWE
jgi:hypothetical protein